jgi:hypothetical protein
MRRHGHFRDEATIERFPKMVTDNRVSGTVQ